MARVRPEGGPATGKRLRSVGGAIALAASWVIVAVADHVPGGEVRVFEWINGLPDGLWPILWAPMQLGGLLGSLVVVIAQEP